MKKGQMYLWNCINKNLKENELIYIIREEELKYTYDMQIFESFLSI